MSSRNELWVVVPAYNEEGEIGRTLHSLRAVVQDVVIVDDCSRDGTLQAAQQAGVHVLSHPFNLGQGAALQTGIGYALARGAQYVATFDADGQHDPADLLPMLAQLKRSHAEVALGSRFLGTATGMPWLRLALLKLAIAQANLSLRLSLTDTHNGIRVMTRHFLEGFSFRQNRMAHASEILQYVARHRIPYVECPVSIHYTAYSRRKGQSSINAIRILIDTVLGGRP
jgi:glycosyltransferase involved in cell wall biosynthesis